MKLYIYIYIYKPLTWIIAIFASLKNSRNIPFKGPKCTKAHHNMVRGWTCKSTTLIARGPTTIATSTQWKCWSSAIPLNTPTFVSLVSLGRPYYVCFKVFTNHVSLSLWLCSSHIWKNLMDSAPITSLGENVVFNYQHHSYNICKQITKALNPCWWKTKIANQVTCKKKCKFFINKTNK